MPKALYIDPNETLRPQDHELELPKIPVTGGRKQPVWDFILQKKWRMT